MSITAIASAVPPVLTDDRRPLASLLVPAAELLVVLGLMEIDLWYVRGTDDPLLHAVIFGAMVAVIWSSLSRRQRCASMTHEVTTAARAWGECLGLTACAAVALFAAAWLFRDPDEGFRFYFRRRPPVDWFAWLAIRATGAVVQQLGLQLFIAPVCREIVRRDVLAIGTAGILFGILHLPQPILVAITVVIGSLWVWLYGRSGRLAPVIACHAVLSLLAAGALPQSVIGDMDIGGKAFAQMINPRYLCTADVREAVELVRTAAYFARHGDTRRGFIEGIHWDFLGREPTAEELDKWLVELSENSRARTALSMFKSRAFDKVRPCAIARDMNATSGVETVRDKADDPMRRR